MKSIPIDPGRWRRFQSLLFFFLLLFGAMIAGAQEKGSDTVAVQRKALEVGAEALAELKSDLEAQRAALAQRLAGLDGRFVDQTLLEEARLALESARVNTRSAVLDRTAVEQRVEALKQEIEALGEQLRSAEAAREKEERAERLREVRQRIEEKQTLLELAERHLTQLGKRIGLLKKSQKLEQTWWQRVREVYEEQREVAREESLAELEKRLHEEERRAQKRSAALQAELGELTGSDPATRARRDLLNLRLGIIGEGTNLLRTRLNGERLMLEFEKGGFDAASGLSPDALKERLGELKGLREGLQPVIALNDSKLEVLRQQLVVLEKQHTLEEISTKDFHKVSADLKALITGLESEQRKLHALDKQIVARARALEGAYASSIKQSLRSRQPLPRDLPVWRSMAAELSTLPTRLLETIKDAGEGIAAGWRSSTWEWRALYLLLASLMVVGARLLGWLPGRSGLGTAGDLLFSIKARTVALALLRESRFSLLVGGELLLAGWAFGLEARYFHLLILLAITWISLRWMLSLFYWLFDSPLVHPGQRHPDLERLFRRAAYVAALFAVLVGLGQLGFLSETLRNLINRLFMFMLLPGVYLALRLRTLFLSRLRAAHKPSFWLHLGSMVSFAIPLTVLVAASVGLLGYVNLAWFVAGQLALFLAVGMVWMVARHFVLDLSRTLKRRVSSTSERGELWIKGVIEPLEFLLRVALFVAAVWSLLALSGWSAGPAMAEWLRAWAGQPLFSVGGSAIVLKDAFAALVTVVVALYAGLWIRRLSRDWMYRRVSDHGLRNSLSVFTQYVVVVVGVLVALNLLGINLTSLAVFAGALGVGIGFGLQNIANNFISGLILLAERPVRTEDWVSIAGSEGQVSRIGMRSLTVTTWDNQDVIIPNAELISKPFTNWTLSDKLLRTVFLVGVRYQDDPHEAQRVILEAVSMQPEVSLEQPPRVLLAEFGASSVDFRVEFHVNVETFSRLGVKSKVMFAIWDALREADIGIPFPQQDIYIKELPGAGIDPAKKNPTPIAG